MSPTPEQLAIKVGDLIVVTQDDGSPVLAICRAAPWRAASGDWMLKYSGRTGGYLLTRCWPWPWFGDDMDRMLEWLMEAEALAAKEQDRRMALEAKCHQYRTGMERAVADENANAEDLENARRRIEELEALLRDVAERLLDNAGGGAMRSRIDAALETP